MGFLSTPTKYVRMCSTSEIVETIPREAVIDDDHHLPHLRGHGNSCEHVQQG